MIKIKDTSVALSGLCPQIVLALVGTVVPIYAEYGLKDVVITSGNDSHHSKSSLHYSGQAVDLRVWSLPTPDKVAEEIGAALGMDFDCIYEGDHIHLEYQPKRRDL